MSIKLQLEHLIMLDITSPPLKISHQTQTTNLPSPLKKDQLPKEYSFQPALEPIKSKSKLSTILPPPITKTKPIISILMDLISLLFSSIVLSPFPEKTTLLW